MNCSTLNKFIGIMVDSVVTAGQPSREEFTLARIGFGLLFGTNKMYLRNSKNLLSSVMASMKPFHVSMNSFCGAFVTFLSFLIHFVIDFVIDYVIHYVIDFAKMCKSEEPDFP